MFTTIPSLLIADMTCHDELGISCLCLGSGLGPPLHYLPSSLSLHWSVSRTLTLQRILSLYV